MQRDSTPTLFEWAGGKPVIERPINAFYDGVEHDEPDAEMFEHAPVPRWG